MSFNMIQTDNQDFEVFLAEIKNDGKIATIEVAEHAAEKAADLARKKLAQIKRKGAVPQKRGVHLFEDVKIFRQPSKGRVQVGGGKKTGTLWHIVNDGTYRSRGHHFMDEIIQELDKSADEIWKEAVGK